MQKNITTKLMEIMRKIEPIFIVILIGLVVIGSALINIFSQ